MLIWLLTAPLFIRLWERSLMGLFRLVLILKLMFLRLILGVSLRKFVRQII